MVKLCSVPAEPLHEINELIVPEVVMEGVWLVVTDIEAAEPLLV